MVAELLTGMEALVDGPEPRLEDVRIDLCRRQIGVPEHHLNRAQISAALQQVRGVRMPEHMWTERSRQAGARAVRLEDLPTADSAQRATAGVEKQARCRA